MMSTSMSMSMSMTCVHTNSRWNLSGCSDAEGGKWKKCPFRCRCRCCSHIDHTFVRGHDHGHEIRVLVHVLVEAVGVAVFAAWIGLESSASSSSSFPHRHRVTELVLVGAQIVVVLHAEWRRSTPFDS